MTNSHALITARLLRIRAQAIQTLLDELPAKDHALQLRPARVLTALALADAEDLCSFLELLMEQTLSSVGLTP